MRDGTEQSIRRLKKSGMKAPEAREFLVTSLRENTLRTAKEQNWRPAELAMTLADWDMAFMKVYKTKKGLGRIR